MHKLANHFRSLLEQQVEEEEDEEAARDGAAVSRRPLESGKVMAGGAFVKDSLKAEQQAAAQKVSKKLAAARNDLLDSLRDEFAVAPGTDEIREAIGDRVPTGSISVARKRDGEGSEGGN